MNAVKKALVQDFVRAVNAGLALLDEADAETAARAVDEINAALADDPKFREAWNDPEFCRAVNAALEAKGAEIVAHQILSMKHIRYLETLAARLLDKTTKIGEFFTEEQLRGIAAECGLTENDLEQLRRENELKLN